MTKDKFVAFAHQIKGQRHYTALKVVLEQTKSPRNNKIWFELQLVGKPGFVNSNSWCFIKFSDEEKAKAALPKYQAWLEETGLVKKTFTAEQIAQRKAEFEAMFGPENEWPAEQ